MPLVDDVLQPRAEPFRVILPGIQFRRHSLLYAKRMMLGRKARDSRSRRPHKTPIVLQRLSTQARQALQTPILPAAKKP